VFLSQSNLERRHGEHRTGYRDIERKEGRKHNGTKMRREEQERMKQRRDKWEEGDKET
jgi:hypothetical protein